MPQKLIYILEDEPDILQLVLLILKKDGYQVEGYTTCKTFCERVLLAPPHLFILDINLQDGNGLDICKDLRADETTASIPVLIMSANAQYKEQARLAGASAFIAKPFTIAALLESVAKYI